MFALLGVAELRIRVVGNQGLESKMRKLYDVVSKKSWAFGCPCEAWAVLEVLALTRSRYGSVLHAGGHNFACIQFC